MKSAQSRTTASVIALAFLLAIVAAVPVAATIAAVDRGAESFELVPASPLLLPSAELPITLPPPAHAPPALVLEAAPNHHLRVALEHAFVRLNARGRIGDHLRAYAETRIRGINSEIPVFVGLKLLQVEERNRLIGFVGGGLRRQFPNRYFDPNTGRFVTADPMGYTDGPSTYQGFGSSPLNYGDPMGLSCFGIGDPAKRYPGQISSTTVPPLSAKNAHLAGTRHAATGIVFDSRGFPIFDDIAKADLFIDSSQVAGRSYSRQMRAATRSLRSQIGSGQILSSQFTAAQLKAIQAGRAGSVPSPVEIERMA